MRAATPRRNPPTLLLTDDDDLIAAAFAAAAAAAPLSWSVRPVVTSGIPQRPDTERDAVTLEVLHLGGGRPHQARGSLRLLARLGSTVQHPRSSRVAATFTTTKHWLPGREIMVEWLIKGLFLYVIRYSLRYGHINYA